jgi:membrane protease YdiL (CAAX protease family)
MACGAVVLTWLYNRAGQSILIVAIWHGTYNIVSGTAGADVTIAATVSTCIIALAIALVVRDIRARRAGRGSVLGPDEAPPSGGRPS